MERPFLRQMKHVASCRAGEKPRASHEDQIRDAEKDPVLSNLLATPGGTQTVPFNFVFPTDTQYYVRQKTDPVNTWIIDAKMVVATQACPREPSTDTSETAKPTKLLFPSP